MYKRQVKGVFRTLKDQVILGGQVTKGKITKDLLVRIKHDGEQISEAKVASVQREQQEAKEVFEGEMCGLNLATTGKVAVEVNDKLEFFTREIVKRTL